VSAPNLFVIGAQKCGTTWLHRQLALHSEIFMSRPKELDFFGRAENVGNERALAAYLARFDGGQGARWRGESTPHYFWKRASGVPGGDHDPATFLRDTLGTDLRLIVLLRDPVSRAASGYYHNFTKGRVPEGMRIFDVPQQYGVVDLGHYRRHWEHWAAVFGAERLEALHYQDIVDKPRRLLRRVFQKLEVDPDDEQFWGQARPGKVVHSKQHVDKSARPISAVEVEALYDLYLDDIDFAEALLGIELPSWRDRDRLISKLANDPADRR
jgi:hypothetical protein